MLNADSSIIAVVASLLISLNVYLRDFGPLTDQYAVVKIQSSILNAVALEH